MAGYGRLTRSDRQVRVFNERIHCSLYLDKCTGEYPRIFLIKQIGLERVGCLTMYVFSEWGRRILFYAIS